jgi:uncharacterized protein YneF (UPF0154 family)
MSDDAILAMTIAIGTVLIWGAYAVRRVMDRSAR